MEKKKLDRIIDIIREQMVAGAGGFTSAANPKGDQGCEEACYARGRL